MCNIFKPFKKVNIINIHFFYKIKYDLKGHPRSYKPTQFSLIIHSNIGNIGLFSIVPCKVIALNLLSFIFGISSLLLSKGMIARTIKSLKKPSSLKFKFSNILQYQCYIINIES